MKGGPHCMPPWRLSVAILSGVLGFAATAHAECAWVLWVRHEDWASNDIEAVDMGAWEPHSAYKTLQGCEERQTIEELDRAGTIRWRCIPATLKPYGRTKEGAVTTVPCLPDTVDPRGPKTK
jgi:hypothetical protein